MEQRTKWRGFGREFLYLWIPAATLGALSSLLVPFPQAVLQRALLIPIRTDSTNLLLAVLILQISFRLAVAVGVGLIAARQIGLGAPVVEAWLQGKRLGQLVRRPLAAIILTVILSIACYLLANSSLLHPNRQKDAIVAEEIANSPTGAKLSEQIEQLGLVGTKSYTGASLFVSNLANAIGGELYARLFEISVIAFLLVQVFREQKTAGNRYSIWAAILLAALLNLASSMWVRHQNGLTISEIFRGLGLPYSTDPNWLVLLRDGILILPPGIALGWVYARYGIESAVAAHFLEAILSIPAIEVWASHFRL